jgi:hypothetical protein
MTIHAIDLSMSQDTESLDQSTPSVWNQEWSKKSAIIFQSWLTLNPVPHFGPHLSAWIRRLLIPIRSTQSHSLNISHQVLIQWVYHVAPIPLQPDYNPDPILDTDFNVFEVKLATKKLKPGKATGNGLIPNEIWKFGSAPILLLLGSPFQLCLDRGRVPLSLCEVIIRPLLKKRWQQD